MRTIGVLHPLTLALLLASCSSEATLDASRAPEQIGDGWKVAAPAQFGAEVSLLDTMLARTSADEYVNIHSILVVKDDALVLEAYFDGYDRTTLHQIRSATKSIGSVLTGIAIDRGFVASEHEPVYRFFEDDYTPTGGWTQRSREVTLHHLLSMMSGYDCDDHATDFGCEHAMYDTGDWVQYSLDLPFAFAPGEHWAYNSSSLILVGEAVARGSGIPMDAFADRYLFGPLGIEQFRWEYSPKRRAWIGGGARMIPREMAKIGLLMLARGRWQGEQLLSEEWIDRSTVKQGEMQGAGVDYGYLWQRGWSYLGGNLITGYWASGNGGQYIIVLPDSDMVVVFTGGNYNSNLANQPFEMLTRYILPAFFAPDPLEPVSLDQSEMERLTGRYLLDFDPSAGSTVSIHEGRLRVLSPLNEWIDLVPHSPTFFTGRSQHGPLTFVFEVDADGRAARHTVYGGFQRFVLELEQD